MNIETAQSPSEETDLLSQNEAAAKLRVSRRTLQRYRNRGCDGPAFVRVGPRRICYRARDLDAWLDARREARA